MNILKIQDSLKNLSDDQLAQEMRLPSGTAPQYLIMTEMQRRQKMRDEFSGSQPPKTTMAEEMSGEAPPEPPMGGEADAQGIMGLPDQTMAGGAMRARISGQPQQVEDMTAMPPQAMATGGAVTFGDPFAGSFQQDSTPYQGYAPVKSYSPKPYTPAKTTDYSNIIRNQFDPFHPPKGTPNPRVRSSPYVGLDLPKGMMMPTEGTAGLVRNMSNSMKNPQFTGYSWASPEYRDAYIRYMTPPASTAAPAAATAPAAGANAPVTKAGGGPIRMFGGQTVDGGGIDWGKLLGDETTPEQVYSQMTDADLVNMLRKKPEELNTRFGAWGGNPVSLTREGLIAEINRRNEQNPIVKGIDTVGRAAFPVIDTVTGAVKGVGKGIYDINKSVYNYVNPFAKIQMPDAAYGESERGHGATPTPPSASPAVTGANASQKKATPPTAAVSGQPEKKGNAGSTATDGGLAALLAAQQDTGSKYKTEANALLDQLRGDKEEMRQTDINNALIKLGLGLAGSKANNLAAGLSEAGLPALQEYTAAREGRRKDERGLTADQLAILSKSEEMSQADRKALQDAAIAQREYELGVRKLDIDEKRAAAEGEYYRSRAEGGSAAELNEYKANLAIIGKFANKLTPLTPTEEEALTAARRGVARYNARYGNGSVGIGEAPDPAEFGLVPVN